MCRRLQVPEALPPNPRHTSVLSHVLPHLQVRGVCYKEGVSCSCCQVQLLQLRSRKKEEVSALKCGCQTSASHQPLHSRHTLGTAPEPSGRLVSQDCPPPKLQVPDNSMWALSGVWQLRKGGLKTLESVGYVQRGLSLGDKEEVMAK